MRSELGSENGCSGRLRVGSVARTTYEDAVRRRRKPRRDRPPQVLARSEKLGTTLAEKLKPIRADLARSLDRKTTDTQRRPPARLDADDLGADSSDATFLARVLSDVVPLEKPARVPVAPSSRTRRVSAPPSDSPCFVLDVQAGRLHGYRDELGPRALQRLLLPSWFPQESLDLHGHRLSGLSDFLGRQLRAFARAGCRRLLIIHGKGRRSKGGVSVLSEAVVEALTEGPAARVVRAFATAPRRLGGSGALMVELDRSGKGGASRSRSGG